MESKLYVGNLSYDVTDEDLLDLFAQAGTVKSAAVIKDRDTGRSKGFGFVEMSTAAEAQKAIGLFHGVELQERALTVNIARPKEERPRSGGFDNRRSSGDRSGGGDRSRGGSSGGGSKGNTRRRTW